MATRVFITGSTGYIGGAVLAHLLLDSKTKDFAYSALVRSPERAKTLPSQVTRVTGDLDSIDVITKAASEADVIIHTADADHLLSAKAIVEGMKGKKNILIHTSGTGVLTDDAKGKFASDFIFSDLDVESAHNLPLTQPHKNVDAFLFESEVSDRVMIICPPLIYGFGSGAGKHFSQQIPTIINASLKRGKVESIGPGLNIWNHVHIEDLADLYVLLTWKALAGEIKGGKQTGWYFAESGQHEWKEIFEKIGELFHHHGITSSPKVEPIASDSQVVEIYGPYAWMALASNSRCRADRARQIGWNPSRVKMIDTLEKEVEYHLGVWKKSQANQKS